MFLTMGQVPLSTTPCRVPLALSGLRTINDVPTLGRMGSHSWRRARVPLVCLPPTGRFRKGVG